MNNYENKVAVITGGTSGLGYAFAELLGKAVAKIQYCVSLPGVFESDVSNGTCYRSEKYRNPGEQDVVAPTSKAHTPDGDKLGMITAEETAQIIIDQMEAVWQFEGDIKKKQAWLKKREKDAKFRTMLSSHIMPHK